MKWVLANELVAATSMNSTADDHPDNLTVSIEQEYSDIGAEMAVMKRFRGCLGLEKKK